MLWTPSSFSALTLLVGSFDPLKLVSDKTYNVFGGKLNLALPQPSTCTVCVYRQVPVTALALELGQFLCPAISLCRYMFC